MYVRIVLLINEHKNTHNTNNNINFIFVLFYVSQNVGKLT